MDDMKTMLISITAASILLTACSASPQETKVASTASTEWTVTNPSSGSELYVRKYTPDSYVDDALNTLILVPGGNGDSSSFAKGKNSAQNLADEGFIVITFDPEGRGLSEGTEDYNGTIGQDGLKAVIESVDSEHVGLVTFSYGITLGSGVLARYPELPVEFLIDWEGPVDRNDTGGCDADNLGHLSEVTTCDDESFWAEREALTFISQVKVPYLRMQSQKDHVQPDLNHALAILNAALGGESPWVRMNDGEVNAVYSSTEELPLLTEAQDKNLMMLVATYAQELF